MSVGHFRELYIFSTTTLPEKHDIVLQKFDVSLPVTPIHSPPRCSHMGTVYMT